MLQRCWRDADTFCLRSSITDGVDAPDGIRCAKVVVSKPLRRGASMEEVSIIGLDLAKNVFQAHGAAPDGSVVFRRKLTRGQVLRFFASQPSCTVTMEACDRSAGSSSQASRARGYAKPFVKRHKNDTADAEAIVEAALRPTMRDV